MSKEAWIFWDNFFRSPTFGMAVSSSTNEACLTGGPANPATIFSFLLKVLAGDPAYLWCPNRFALGQAGGLYHLPPVGLWSNAFKILCGAFCPRVPHPQGHQRSHASPVYASLGTSHAYPETYPSSSCSCGCRGVDVGCHLLPASTCQCSSLACGGPLVPTGEPPWPLRGLCCVGGLSLGTGSGILFGSWAAEWLWQPPLALLQYGSTPLSP